MILQGRNLIIKVGGVAVACSRSCELNIDNETIEVASPTSGKCREYIAGRKSWSVSVGSLVRVNGTADNLRTLVNLPGQTVTLTFCVGDGEIYKWQGSAICTKAGITGTIGNLAQGSFNFQGSGELVDQYATINVRSIISRINPVPVAGYHFMRDFSQSLVSLLYSNGSSITFCTPDANIKYVYNSNDYKWNGSAFVIADSDEVDSGDSEEDAPLEEF